MSILSEYSRRLLDEQERLAEEEEEIEREKNATYAGRGYGHRVSFLTDLEQEKYRVLEKEQTEAIREVFRVTGLLPVVPTDKIVESDFYEQILSKQHGLLFRTIQARQQMESLNLDFAYRIDFFNSYIDLICESIYQSEILVALNVPSLFSAGMIAANSMVNYVAAKSPYRSECYVLGKWSELFQLPHVSEKLLSGDEKVRCLNSNSRYELSNKLWEYGNMYPTTEGTHPMNVLDYNKFGDCVYQDAVKSLKLNFVKQASNFDTRLLLALNGPSSSDNGLYNHTVATNIILASSFNEMNPERPINIIANRSLWKNFIDELYDFCEVDKDLLNQFVAYGDGLEL